MKQTLNLHPADHYVHGFMDPSHLLINNPTLSNRRIPNTVFHPPYLALPIHHRFLTSSLLTTTPYPPNFSLDSLTPFSLTPTSSLISQITGGFWEIDGCKNASVASVSEYD